MKKFENVYQDAALMKKALLGEANESEQQKLEKRLAECPDLENRTNGTGDKEASSFPDLVVCCSSCCFFSNRFIFLYVELCFD